MTSYGPSRVLRAPGGRADWHPSDPNQVVLDYPGTNGYYDLAIMTIDGTSQPICLTCNHPVLNWPGHRGNPIWHPTGAWVVFQGQKPGGILPYFSLPGYGAYSDLWAMRLADRAVVQLTTTAHDTNSGVLHPHFSRDGSLLSWSQMVQRGGNGPAQRMGYWKLLVAPVSIDAQGLMQIGQPEDKTPTLPGIYENHGFSPNGQTMIFTANTDLLTQTGSTITNIFTLDIQSGAIQQLTHGEGGHNEHATYTPDGTGVVWMTGRDNWNLGTDLWYMQSDGSGARRITGYNQPHSPEYMGHTVYAAKSAISPDGTSILCYVQDNLGKQTGLTLIRPFTGVSQ